jgi:hypothetical protein
MEAPSSIPFSALARARAGEARRHGLAVPAFSCPPRLPGANRTIRLMQGGGIMVSVRTKDRRLDQVIDDMVEGVLRANGLSGREASGWRLALQAAVGGGEAMAA